MFKRVLYFPIFCIALTSLSALSQTSNGSLTGEVMDKSGAVIPNAKLTVRNDDTQTVVESVTSRDGVYRIPSLEPGTYSVSVNKDGFDTEQVGGVSIETARVTTVNITMKVGSVSEVVHVDAGDQLLSPDSATLTATIDSNLAGSVPLPERSALELALLSAGAQGDPEYSGGVQSENPNAFTQPNTPGASIALSGGRPGSTAQLVDGLDVTLTAYPRAGITFSPYTIKEITVQQNGLAAQYGRSGGGIINQSTAGGGSKYHGVFEYRHIDSFLQAWTYGSTTEPQYHQNLYGAMISGPVPMPHFISHGGKTFFLASVEPLRASNEQSLRTRLVTPSEAAGQMHNSLDLLNQTVLDTQGYAAAIAVARVGCSGTTVQCASATGNTYPATYYQFPQNAQGFPTGKQTKPYTAIPNDDVSAQLANNPVAKAFFGLLPLSTTTPTPYAAFIHPDASYDSDGNNGIGVRGVVNTDNRYSLRIDQVFNDSNQAFARYTRVPVQGTRFNYLGPNNPLDNIPTDTYVSQDWAVDYVHTFHGAEVNVLRASYIRTNRFRGPIPASLTQDFATALGLYPSFEGKGYPGISFTQASGSVTLGNFGGGGSITDGGTAIDTNLSYGDDFTFTRGRHAIQFGGEVRFLQLNREDVSYLTGGQYTFPYTLTNNGTSGGSSLTSFILGLINTYTTATPQEYYYRDKYYAGYIQDDWKVMPHVTLNIGVRYNLEPPRTEAHGLQGIFLPTVTGTAPNGVAATGGFAFSGQNGLPKTLWPTFYKGIEPRIGIAYQPRGFMTVRASFSLIHTPLTGVGNAIVPNLASTAQSVGPTTGGVNPAAELDYITNPVAPIAVTATPTSGPLFSYSNTAYFPNVNQTNAVPYTQLWSASMQFSLSANTLFEASYAGQHAVHLFTLPVATNVPSYAQSLADVQSGLNYTSNSVTNAYGLGTETLLQSQSPYQQFAKNPINTAYDRIGNSNYNAFYATARHRYGAGFTVFGSFTWSKSMDNASSGTLSTVATDIYGIVNPQLPYNYATEYSLSLYDTPVKISTAYSLNLPFGPRARFRSGNRIVDAIAGGFTTSGIFTAQSGFPWWVNLGNCGWYTSTLPGSYSGSGGCTLSGEALRPNIVPGVPLIKPNWRQDPFGISPGDSYLNPAAFAVPGSPGNPQLGNAPRTLGNARNPRTIYYDASLRKTVNFAENRLNLTLLVDAINVMNHTNFFPSQALTNRSPFGSLTTAGTYNGSSSFGKFSQSGNNPGRNFGFGVLLRF